jgi:integrase
VTARVKDRRGITRDEYKTILACEKYAEWKLFFESLWETGAAQGDAAILTVGNIEWSSWTITYFRKRLVRGRSSPSAGH